MKKLYLLIIILLIPSFLFSQNIFKLFDKAESEYIIRKYDESLETLSRIESIIKQEQEEIERINSIPTIYREVTFDKLYKFTDEYNVNHILLKDAIIYPSRTGKKMENGNYPIRISNETDSVIFDVVKKESTLVFLIDYNLLEYLLDTINENESSLFNIYAEIYSETVSPFPFINEHTFYYAQIEKIEPSTECINITE